MNYSAPSLILVASLLVLSEVSAEETVVVDMDEAIEVATSSGYTIQTNDGAEIFGQNAFADTVDEGEEPQGDIIVAYHLDSDLGDLDEENEDESSASSEGGSHEGRQVQGHMTITTITKGPDGKFQMITQQRAAQDLVKHTQMSKVLKQMLASIKGMMGVPSLFGLPIMGDMTVAEPNMLADNKENDELTLLDVNHG